jgi:hypothetical protein
MKYTNVTASYINTTTLELYASIYHLQELKNKTLIMMINEYSNNKKVITVTQDLS